MTRVASGLVLLCAMACLPQLRPSLKASELRANSSLSADGATALRFTHLTTKDGLSQSGVTEILQDRRGFMWFGTRDGLNRYDGNTFVVYKNNPNDPASLSSNFIQDLIEDDHGFLWVATNFGGVNRFDPATERCVRYRHDPKNANTLSGDSVETIARDTRGRLWFGTGDSGLDQFDPSTGIFTHYLNDNDGNFVGRITKVVASAQGNIWFVGERGLFLLNPETGRITHAAAAVTGADYVYEDDAENLWMVTWSPIVGLVKYDPRADRLTNYPFETGAVGVASANLLADGQNGFWAPSSQGLYYFDRRKERFTFRFQHDETNANSLDDNTVVAVYRDRAGLLWAGTAGGLNLLNLRQRQFGYFRHSSDERNSLSPGRVTAIYEEPNHVLWIGFLPRALDRLDRNTGQITHYIPNAKSRTALGNGMNVAGIYKDARGYVWLGGWGAGLDRLDERTGQFRHYRHNTQDRNSLISDGIYTIYKDRSDRIWVGELYGLSRFDPSTEQLTNYQPDPKNRSWNRSSVSSIYQDRSGALWLGTTGGALIRADEKTGDLVSDPLQSQDTHLLNGGSITAIHEDRAGTLWVAAWDGLYRWNRQERTFKRYTENEGLPSAAIQGILEDKAGKLWLSTKKGISRFDVRAETFRNYDVFDGLQGDEFSQGAYAQGSDGEMFFCGSGGFNAFFPEEIRDDPYVPPVVITSFKIFNKPVSIGPKAPIQKAIAYVDSLTLPYADNVFSFEFAALSYANSHKNRYRYRLEPFQRDWNEVGSKQPLATYTNLDAGDYLFRVQGANSDGVWNEAGVSLRIVITPPWWETNWFRALCAGFVIALLWAAYELRLRQLRREFSMATEARVNERMRIARDLHDTMLQTFQAALIRMQAARNVLGRSAEKAADNLDDAITVAAKAVTEGRSAIQGLRTDSGGGADLAKLLAAAGQEMGQFRDGQANPPAFSLTVEGARRSLEPVLQDEVYRVGRELLRNAFQHAHASRIEVEIRYDSRHFRLHVRDDGTGIDPKILEAGGCAGHWGLRGMWERVDRFGGRLEFWSATGAGAEAVLTVPAERSYSAPHDRSVFSLLRRKRKAHEPNQENPDPDSG